MNVYAPCNSAEKRILWDLIRNVISQIGDCLYAVVGDFNAIRDKRERKGRGLVVDHRDISAFCDFIAEANLFELPLRDKAFTWFKKDGSCKSKLDRIFVCEDWINRWPQYSVRSCGRTFSDHCPIFINSITQDWGSRPFKFFNSWIAHPDFETFINNRWQQYKVDGWTGFRLKEKLKLLKMDLKSWNILVFGNKEQQIATQKQEIEILDRFDEVFRLEEDELINRNRLSTELLRNLIWRDSMMAQKAKVRWLKEGDVNSGFFHSWVNKNTKSRGIEGIMINGHWEDSADRVKEAAANFFQNQFKARRICRPQFPEDLFERKTFWGKNFQKHK